MNNAQNSASRRSDAAVLSEQVNKTLPPGERLRQAVARIEASRSALIMCISPAPAELSDGPGNVDGRDEIEQSFAQTLAARIERNGLLQGSWRTLRPLARRWWTSQPWHSSVDLVGQTLAHQARPLMRRNPLATLALGAAVGAGVVAVVSTMRPWISSHTRRKASLWSDRVGGLLWSQLSSAPLQMALAGALAAWLADQGSHKTRAKRPSANPLNDSDPSEMPNGVGTPVAM